MSSYQSDLRRTVDEILYYIWDPIGVSAEPGTRDEYDAYVPERVSLLERNASSDEIAQHLNGITTRKMGMHANDKHALAMANLLISWSGWLQEKWPLACDRKQ